MPNLLHSTATAARRRVERHRGQPAALKKVLKFSCCSGVSPLPFEDSAGSTPPSAFGSYRVLHQIGSGVLGPVFRTYEPQVDRLVAVKAFKLDLVPEDVARLADALRRLAAHPTTHPGIVRVLDAGLEGTSPFVAMEYASGESLDVALRDFTPGLGRALPVLIDVGRAIDAAWAEGRGHGALHPRDVIVSSGRDTRITGFGIISGARVDRREGPGSPAVHRARTRAGRGLGHPGRCVFARRDCARAADRPAAIGLGRAGRHAGAGADARSSASTCAASLAPRWPNGPRIDTKTRARSSRLSKRSREATRPSCRQPRWHRDGHRRSTALKTDAPSSAVPTPRTWQPHDGSEAARPRRAAAEGHRTATRRPRAHLADAPEGGRATCSPHAPTRAAMAMTADATKPLGTLHRSGWRSSLYGQRLETEFLSERRHRCQRTARGRLTCPTDAAPAVVAPLDASTVPPPVVPPPAAAAASPVSRSLRPRPPCRLYRAARFTGLRGAARRQREDHDDRPWPWGIAADLQHPERGARLAAGISVGRRSPPSPSRVSSSVALSGMALASAAVATVVTGVTTAPPGSRTTTDVPITAEPPPKPPAAPAAPESRPAGPTAAVQKPDEQPIAPAARAADVRGRIVVRSTPSGAIVRVDGRLHGETPITIRDLALGAHTLQVARPGFVPRTNGSC